MHLLLLVFVLLVGYSGRPIWATESKKCSKVLMLAKLTNPYLPLLPNRTYTMYRLNTHSDDTSAHRENNTITREDFFHQGKHATEVRTDLTSHSLFGTGVLVHSDFLLIARDPINGRLYRAKKGPDGQYGQWQEGSPRHYFPSAGSQVQWLQKENYRVPQNIVKANSIPKTFPDVMISTIK